MVDCSLSRVLGAIGVLNRSVYRILLSRMIHKSRKCIRLEAKVIQISEVNLVMKITFTWFKEPALHKDFSVFAHSCLELTTWHWLQSALHYSQVMVMICVLLWIDDRKDSRTLHGEKTNWDQFCPFFLDCALGKEHSIHRWSFKVVCNTTLCN